MSQIKIETITPVHIGSGNALFLNNEILDVGNINGKKGRYLAVIDPQKVLEQIGEDKVVNWISAITNQESLANGLLKDKEPQRYSKRIVLSHVGTKSWPKPKQLNEQIHDGMGRPYIPGSSIKGAIRTAVLATLARPQANRLNIGQGRITGNFVEEQFFGRGANQSVFRFLQVGDATFMGDDTYKYDDCTEALRMVNLNERDCGNYWDMQKAGVVEVLRRGLSANFRLKIDDIGYELALERNVVHNLPNEMSTLQQLFKTINEHTKSLLSEEIDYWDRSKNDETKSDYVPQYIVKCEDLYHKAKDCNAQSCLLRIGSGSGWRFITGAWAEERHDFENLIPKLRPDKRHKYDQYWFPKTRRLSDHLDLLGFVKLTIIE